MSLNNRKGTSEPIDEVIISYPIDGNTGTIEQSTVPDVEKCFTDILKPLERTLITNKGLKSDEPRL